MENSDTTPREQADQPGRTTQLAETSPAEPSPQLIRTWQQYLANERYEERIYRQLARRKTGEFSRILTALADAEHRHQQHWIRLLGKHATTRRRPSVNVFILATLGRIFGSVFILALAQQAETRTPYDEDAYATETMAADEKIHAEVVRALAAQSRAKMSGNFRAALFGANDGLVSNLALVLGVGAAGLTSGQVLLTGISGLLSGALSMGAGEYISVRSQKELLEASQPDPAGEHAVAALDINANELALVYRARGMNSEEAEAAAHQAITSTQTSAQPAQLPRDAHTDESITGSGLGAGISSFMFFASGAAVPVIPYIFGLGGMTAMILATVLVSVALVFTGGVVGVLSGKSPGPMALRQFTIGLGAALVTYLLGLAFGTVVH